MLSKSFWSWYPDPDVDDCLDASLDEMLKSATSETMKEFLYDDDCMKYPELEFENVDLGKGWKIDDDDHDDVLWGDRMWCADYDMIPPPVSTAPVKDPEAVAKRTEEKNKLLELVNPDLITSFRYNTVKEEPELPSIKEEPETMESSVASPYTPDNDHSYYQPKSVETVSREQEPESGFSDSGSESSGDEIDIEYVTPQNKPHAEIVKNEIKKQEQEALQKIISKRISRKYQKRTKAVAYISNKRIKVEPIQISKKHKHKRLSYGSSCSSRSCSDCDDFPHNRASHNDSERRRRDIQRLALQELRLSIPHLKDNPKAPKVKILNEGTKYCEQLTVENSAGMELVKELKKTRNMLFKKLNILKRECLPVRRR